MNRKFGRQQITPAGVSYLLDNVSGSVEEWLDEKELLDAEFVAEDGFFIADGLKSLIQAADNEWDDE
jgi:hypothetical protein